MLHTRNAILLLLISVLPSGCVLHVPKPGNTRGNLGETQVEGARHQRERQVVEMDGRATDSLTDSPLALVSYTDLPDSSGPRSLDTMPQDFWDITIDDAVHYALQHSEVIRDIGGRVLSNPTAVQTRYNPSITYNDPFFGVEAALSAFDANLANQFSYANNDRVFNNVTLGGGAQELRQDLTTMQTELSKLAATGTQMNLRSIIGHDRNNRSGNLFGHLWESQLEAEVRQPLLQGAGLSFNRIAGPNATPGLRFSNGVVLAQMNTDISKIDFEIAVRDLVSQVVDAYWQLYRAYHDFDAKQATRLAAEETWKATQAKYERGMAGGEADKEAQARAQFYLYQDLSIEALNGSGATVGVYESERSLRLLMGLGVNDGSLLRPIDSVSTARVLYDWDTLAPQAVQRLAEIRRQRWLVKQEELRLIAAKNFVLPRLDATALYRLRGFGDDLAGGGDGGRFASAGDDMSRFDHQEWEFGLLFNVPIGRRQAYAGVRHAELRLCRERGILREQELQAKHNLANAIGRDEQTHASMEASYQRLEAAQDRLDATDAAFESDKVPLDLLLEAQERLDAARSRYYQLVASHAIAEKNVQAASGNLLCSFGVQLQGDGDPTFCCRRTRCRDRMDYRFQVPSQPSAITQVNHAYGGQEVLQPMPPRRTLRVLEEIPELVDFDRVQESGHYLAPLPLEADRTTVRMQEILESSVQSNNTALR